MSNYDLLRDTKLKDTIIQHVKNLIKGKNEDKPPKLIILQVISTHPFLLGDSKHFIAVKNANEFKSLLQQRINPSIPTSALKGAIIGVFEWEFELIWKKFTATDIEIKVQDIEYLDGLNSTEIGDSMSASKDLEIKRTFLALNRYVESLRFEQVYPMEESVEKIIRVNNTWNPTGLLREVNKLKKMEEAKLWRTQVPQFEYKSKEADNSRTMNEGSMGFQRSFSMNSNSNSMFVDGMQAFSNRENDPEQEASHDSKRNYEAYSLSLSMKSQSITMPPKRIKLNMSNTVKHHGKSTTSTKNASKPTFNSMRTIELQRRDEPDSMIQVEKRTKKIQKDVEMEEENMNMNVADMKIFLYLFSNQEKLF